MKRLAPGELNDLAGTLAAAKLPTADLAEPGHTFVRFADDAGLVGFGGIEGDGSDRLLRSLVVVAERRSTGLGLAMLALLEDEARRQAGRTGRGGQGHGVEMPGQHHSLVALTRRAGDDDIADAGHREVRQSPQSALDGIREPGLVSTDGLDVADRSGERDDILAEIERGDGRHAATLATTRPGMSARRAGRPALPRRDR